MTDESSVNIATDEVPSVKTVDQFSPESAMFF